MNGNDVPHGLLKIIKYSPSRFYGHDDGTEIIIQ